MSSPSSANCCAWRCKPGCQLNSWPQHCGAPPMLRVSFGGRGSGGDRMCRSLAFGASAFFFWVASAAGAPVSDFIFGDDLEGVPACTGTGFAIGATPEARSGSLGTQHRYFVKTRACNTSGVVTLGVSGGPTSWPKTLEPTSLTLPDGTVGVALLKVTVPTDAD